MSKKWRIEEVGERFGEILTTSYIEGPQFVVSECGEETAVVIPIGEWRRLNGMKRDIKDLLLAPEARTESLTPPRQPLLHRPPPTFD